MRGSAFPLMLFVGYMSIMGVAIFVDHDQKDVKRHNACVDAGGVPVYFEIHTKGNEVGYKCIADYKLVEIK